MDNGAIMQAIDSLKAGIEQLAAAVGGGEGGEDVAGKGPEVPVGPDAPVNPDESGDAASAEVSAPPRPGMTAMSPEDFVNKKPGVR